jgi:hypothetical protein
MEAVNFLDLGVDGSRVLKFNLNAINCDGADRYNRIMAEVKWQSFVNTAMSILVAKNYDVLCPNESPSASQQWVYSVKSESRKFYQ